MDRVQCILKAYSYSKWLSLYYVSIFPANVFQKGGIAPSSNYKLVHTLFTTHMCNINLTVSDGMAIRTESTKPAYNTYTCDKLRK